MIILTKLDRSKVLVTLETIKYIEETPDTVVRFTNGESLIVREGLREIQTLVDEMRLRIARADRDFEYASSESSEASRAVTTSVS